MAGMPVDKPVFMVEPSGTVARLGCAETKFADIVLQSSRVLPVQNTVRIC